SSSSSRRQWSQWQLIDSILPTGGFAHSFGLEAAIQTGTIAAGSEEQLQTYIAHVLDNTGSLLLPFVRRASLSPDAETLRKLNATLDAAITNETARRASASQGSALLRVAAAVFAEIPSLRSMRNASSSSSSRCHYAPVFGVVFGLLGFDPETAQRAFVFVSMRDLISAATRLGLVGPMGAAVLQHRICGVGEELVGKWKDREVEEACQTCPVLDIVQGCHGYLFSRLFMS
ncbi:hypothetical protein M569_08150, partial [Genlisea aurea]